MFCAGLVGKQFIFRSVTLSVFLGSFLIKRSFAYSSSGIRMQKIRSDGLGGRGITYVPSSGSYKNVVVWMHGLGDTADGWAELMPTLGLRETKFILPTATNRPIAINGNMPMPGWSDIYGLDDRVNEDRVGFDESKVRVDKIVQTEIDKGIESKRIVIAGFSQGGALAFHTALRSSHSIGGCVALSTWVPFSADYPAALSRAASSLKILQVSSLELFALFFF
jgi:predicted esterase